MSLCLEVACSCTGLLGPVALLGISTVRKGEIKRFTREQLTVLTGKGGQTAASWVFFCFDVRPRSDLNPIKGLFVPPGTAEGNI